MGIRRSLLFTVADYSLNERQWLPLRIARDPMLTFPTIADGPCAKLYSSVINISDQSC
jgi:hypothetical protein